MLYVCYDNDGYINTSFQRGSTASHGSNTSTLPADAAIKHGFAYLRVFSPCPASWRFNSGNGNWRFC